MPSAFGVYGTRRGDWAIQFVTSLNVLHVKPEIQTHLLIEVIKIILKF